MVAGSKLYQTVVETDSVAAVLLRNECLMSRETLIPNNKI